MGRAVIVPTLEDRQERQWSMLLDHCRQNGHSVLSMTRDPAAAIALVEAGHADLIIATCLDDYRVLERTTVKVVLLHTSVHRSGGPQGELIREMLSRGGDVATVARLLGLSEAEVQRATGGMTHPVQRHEPGRRTQLVGRAR